MNTLRRCSSADLGNKRNPSRISSEGNSQEQPNSNPAYLRPIWSPVGKRPDSYNGSKSPLNRTEVSLKPDGAVSFTPLCIKFLQDQQKQRQRRDSSSDSEKSTAKRQEVKLHSIRVPKRVRARVKQLELSDSGSDDNLGQSMFTVCN